MKTVLLLIACALAGCKTAPKAVTVDVPVAVGCLGPKPARPVSTFGVGAYPGDKAAAQAALAESSAWQGYAVGLEVAMAGCQPKPAAQ